MRTGFMKFVSLSIILLLMMPLSVTASAGASIGTEARITTDGSNQLIPDISEDRIVWQDDRNGKFENSDIYAFTLRSEDLSLAGNKDISPEENNVDNEGSKKSIEDIISAIFSNILHKLPFRSVSSSEPAATEESGIGSSEEAEVVPDEEPADEGFMEEGPVEEYPADALPEQDAIANPVHEAELPAEEVHEEYAAPGPGEYLMRQGDILKLPGDYELLAKLIDVEGKMVWLEFEKNGDFVDDEILSLPEEEMIWDLYSYPVGGDEELIYRVRLKDVSGDKDIVVYIEFM